MTVLAYVFWHRAATPEGYEGRLAAFHAAPRAHPPGGFRGSRAFRLDAAPWLAGDGPPYEDWYLVESWAALAALNEGSRGPRPRPARGGLLSVAGYLRRLRSRHRNGLAG